MFCNLKRVSIVILSSSAFVVTSCSDESADRFDSRESRRSKPTVEQNGASGDASSGAPRAPRITGLHADMKDVVLGVGQKLKIHVDFDAPVRVVLKTPAAATLQAHLRLETGTFDGEAVHESGDDTSRLTFTYTVQKGHRAQALTVLAKEALVLPKGVEIQSLSGIKADTLIPVSSPQADLSTYKITIDGIAPDVKFRSAILRSGGPALFLKMGLSVGEENGPMRIQVFAGPVAGCDYPAPSVNATGQPVGDVDLENVPVTLNSTTYYSVRVHDRGLNDSGCQHVHTYTHDGILPSVSGISRLAGQPELARSLPVRFAILFSEPIDPATFGPADVANTPDSSARVTWQVFSKGDNKNFEIHAIDATDGIIRPVVAADAVNDLAGNKGPAALFSQPESVELRTAPLTVTISRAAAQLKETASQAINFQVRFSHAIQVDTFLSSDINQVSGTGAIVRSWAVTRIDNQTFNLSPLDVSGNGLIMPQIPEAAVTDMSGFLNAASSAGDYGVVYDTNPPRFGALKMSGKLMSDGSYRGNQSQPSVQGSIHDISGTTVTIFRDGNCRDADQTITGSALPFDVRLARPLTAGIQVNTSVKAVDVAGNSSACMAVGAYFYDNSVPVVRSVSAISPATVYVSGQRLNLRVQFSEPVEVSGLPVLMLNSVPDGKAASYISGSSSDSLVFQYDVAQGDNAARLAYVSTAALQVQFGAAIADAAGNPAELGLAAPGQPNSLDHANSIRVDALSPSFSDQVILMPGNEGEETSISIQLTPSEPLFELGLYADSSCTRPLAREMMVPASTRLMRIPSVIAFATSNVFALGRDTVGNLSGCVYLASYRHRLDNCSTAAYREVEPDPADPYLGQFVNALNACLPNLADAFEPLARVDELLAQQNSNWSDTVSSLSASDAPRLQKLRQYFYAMKSYERVLHDGRAESFNAGIAAVANETSGNWSGEITDLARLERLKLPSIALVRARLLDLPSMPVSSRTSASIMMKNLVGPDIIAFFKSELANASETRDQVLRSMRHFKVQLRLKLASKDGFKPTFLSAKYGSGVTPDYKADGVDTGIRSLSAWYLLKPKAVSDGGFPYLCEFLSPEAMRANIAKYYSPEDIHYIDDYHLPCKDLAGTESAVHVLQVIRRYFPGMMVGFYGYAPHVAYWDPQKSDQNDRNMAAFGKYVDLIMPSAYLMYPTSEKVAYSASGAYSGAQCDQRLALHHNRTLILGNPPDNDPANDRGDIVGATEGAGLYFWKQKRKSLMQEARRLSDASYRQPVLPFLWPQYHERVKVILTSCRDSKTNAVSSAGCLPYVTGNMYMTATAMMLRWGADGVIHWDQAEDFNTWYSSFKASDDGLLSWYEAIIDRPQLQRLAAKSETCVNACPGTWDGAAGAYCQ